MDTKQCKQCNIVKSKTEFYTKSPDCKPCTLKKQKEYRDANKDKLNANRRADTLANPEKYKEKSKRYRTKNADAISERNKEKYVQNKEVVCAKVKKYRDNNPEIIKERKKKYYEANKEELLAISKKWKENNPERNRELALNRWRERYNNDIEFKLKHCLRARARDALKRNTKSASTMELLGCDTDFLKDYLEAEFKPGMTWDNYGSYWHIDHIRPCASFDLTDPEQQKQCFNWSNLQPLEAIENIRKGAKLDWVPGEPKE